MERESSVTGQSHRKFGIPLPGLAKDSPPHIPRLPPLSPINRSASYTTASLSPQLYAAMQTVFSATIGEFSSDAQLSTPRRMLERATKKLGPIVEKGPRVTQNFIQNALSRIPSFQLIEALKTTERMLSEEASGLAAELGMHRNQAQTQPERTPRFQHPLPHTTPQKRSKETGSLPEIHSTRAGGAITPRAEKIDASSLTITLPPNLDYTSSGSEEETARDTLHSPTDRVVLRNASAQGAERDSITLKRRRKSPLRRFSLKETSPKNQLSWVDQTSPTASVELANLLAESIRTELRMREELRQSWFTYDREPSFFLTEQGRVVLAQGNRYCYRSEPYNFIRRADLLNQLCTALLSDSQGLAIPQDRYLTWYAALFGDGIFEPAITSILEAAQKGLPLSSLYEFVIKEAHLLQQQILVPDAEFCASREYEEALLFARTGAEFPDVDGLPEEVGSVGTTRLMREVCDALPEWNANLEYCKWSNGVTQESLPPIDDFLDKVSLSIGCDRAAIERFSTTVARGIIDQRLRCDPLFISFASRMEQVRLLLAERAVDRGGTSPELRSLYGKLCDYTSPQTGGVKRIEFLNELLQSKNTRRLALRMIGGKSGRRFIRELLSSEKSGCLYNPIYKHLIARLSQQTLSQTLASRFTLAWHPKENNRPFSQQPVKEIYRTIQEGEIHPERFTVSSGPVSQEWQAKDDLNLAKIARIPRENGQRDRALLDTLFTHIEAASSSHKSTPSIQAQTAACLEAVRKEQIEGAKLLENPKKLKRHLSKLEGDVPHLHPLQAVTNASWRVADMQLRKRAPALFDINGIYVHTDKDQRSHYRLHYHNESMVEVTQKKWMVITRPTPPPPDRRELEAKAKLETALPQESGAKFAIEFRSLMKSTDGEVVKHTFSLPEGITFTTKDAAFIEQIGKAVEPLLPNDAKWLATSLTHASPA